MKNFIGILLCLLVLSACNVPANVPATSTNTSLPPTSTLTETPTSTFTPEPTFTPTITLTPTITATPTFAFPTVTVNKQAHCRYGPSAAFMHAADLYAGDTGRVIGRFEYSSWLYIDFDKLKYNCWVAPSVVDIVGDTSTLYYQDLNLGNVGHNQYGPPQNVQAVRNGSDVTISWNQVNMSSDKDRGYLIIAFVCQNGGYIWWTFSYPDQFTTSYTVTDEAGCNLPSEGVIYTVEKHGFSEPAQIPWPAP